MTVPLGRHRPQLGLDVALLHRRDTDILHREGNFNMKLEFLMFSAEANLVFLTSKECQTISEKARLFLLSITPTSA